MNKGDYEAVGSALQEAIVYRSFRLLIYRSMVKYLSPRNPDFDPVKFGLCMGLPRLIAEKYKKEEVTKNASHEEDEHCEGEAEGVAR